MLHVLLFLVALSGCDTQTPGADVRGNVSFLLNGEEWAVSADVVASAQSYGYLIGATWASPENPALAQTLTIVLPDLSEQTYPTAESSVDDRLYGLWFTESDADAILSRHVAVDAASQTGGFTVTDFDPATGEIAATFEGTFATRSGNVSIRTLPDTFRVSSGTLQVRLAD